MGSLQWTGKVAIGRHWAMSLVSGTVNDKLAI